MRKLFLSMGVVLWGVMFSFSQVQAGSVFPDVSDNYWAIDYLIELKDLGVLNGDSQTGYMRPQGVLNRAEALAVIQRSLSGNIEIVDETSSFSDIKFTDWFFKPVLWGLQAGVVQGYSTGRLTGEFKPANLVSRAEFVSMLYQAFKLADIEADFPIVNDLRGHWSENMVHTLWAYGVVDLDLNTRFFPDKWLTRAEAAKMVSKSLAGQLRPELVPEPDPETGTGNTSEPETETGSDPVVYPTEVERIIVPESDNLWLVGEYELQGHLEPVVIKKLSFDLEGSNYQNNFAEILLIYPTDYNNPTVLDGKKIGKVSNGKAVFEGLTLGIPKEGQSQFNLYVVVNSIDTADETGARFAFKISEDSQDYEAIGQFSQKNITNLLLTNQGINEITIRKTKPTVNILDTYTTLVYGRHIPVFQFEVTADKAGAIELSRVSFEISVVGLEDEDRDGLDSVWEIFRVDGNRNDLVANAYYQNGYLFFDFIEKISAGQTYVFELQAPQIDRKSGAINPTLNITLRKATDSNASNTENTGTYNQVTTQTNVFIWSDMSAKNHTTATADWTNGYNVLDFSNSSRTLQLAD